MAALLSAGEDSALSHLTAAIMRNWWKRSPLEGIDVTCGREIVNPQLSIHFTRHWNTATDIVVANGLRFTTSERMVLDLGCVLSRFQVTSVVKEAAFWGRFDAQKFQAEALRLNSRAGSVVAHSAVKSYLSGCAGTRSALEDRFLEMIQANRLPMPDEAGCPIGPHEVDLVWFDRGLIIEVDGPGHRQPNSRKKDPQRDADLRAAGYEVVRFTNRAIDANRARATARLEQLLR
jgi:very-short-patch-repair endonuclease